MNVTHRLFTHRLQLATIGRDARRHSHPFWPRNPPNTRGTEDQPGGSCGKVRIASDLLQRHRTGNQERVAGEYREDLQGIEEEPGGVVRPRLTTLGSVTARTSTAPSLHPSNV